FHSHPDCPAQPSGTDREFAWPTIAFVIVTVAQGKATTTHSWQLRDDRSRFDEEPVTVIKE
ncbi:MAG TPA: Mov34/MPN/PAD-1 family protein, partial [Anaerolineae bacterium]